MSVVRGFTKVVVGALVVTMATAAMPPVGLAGDTATRPSFLCLGTADATIRYAPGAFTETRKTKYSFEGADTCPQEDGSVLTATESGSAKGTYNCTQVTPTLRVSGRDVFRWSDGGRSVTKFTDTLIGAVGDTRGVVKRGRFKGRHWRYLGATIPSSLGICLSPDAGRITASYTALARWGTP